MKRYVFAVVDVPHSGAVYDASHSGLTVIDADSFEHAKTRMHPTRGKRVIFLGELTAIPIKQLSRNGSQYGRYYDLWPVVSSALLKEMDGALERQARFGGDETVSVKRWAKTLGYPDDFFDGYSRERECPF